MPSFQNQQIRQSQNIKASKLSAFSASKANSRYVMGNNNQNNQINKYQKSRNGQKSQITVNDPFYKKHWFWAIIGLLILAAVAVGLFFIIKTHTNNPNHVPAVSTTRQVSNTAKSVENTSASGQTNSNTSLEKTVPTADQNSQKITDTNNGSTLKEAQSSVAKTQNPSTTAVIPETSQGQKQVKKQGQQVTAITKPEPFTIVYEIKTIEPKNNENLIPITLPDPQDYYKRHPQQRIAHKISSRTHKKLRFNE